MEDKAKKLNDRIKELLLYTGFAAAAVAIVSYVMIVVSMIIGVKIDVDTNQQITISALGAIVGLVVLLSLQGQGVAFAKQEEESKKAEKAYQAARNKERVKKNKQPRTMTYYYIRWLISDVVFKVSSVGLSMYFVVYIFVEGNGNWGLIWLALSNILMFAGFGLMRVSKAYDVYIEQHIPAIIARTNKILEEQEETEQEEPIPFAELDSDYDNGFAQVEDLI